MTDLGSPLHDLARLQATFKKRSPISVCHPPHSRSQISDHLEIAPPQLSGGIREILWNVLAPKVLGHARWRAPFDEVYF